MLFNYFKSLYIIPATSGQTHQEMLLLQWNSYGTITRPSVLFSQTSLPVQELCKNLVQSQMNSNKEEGASIIQQKVHLNPFASYQKLTHKQREQ